MLLVNLVCFQSFLSCFASILSASSRFCFASSRSPSASCHSCLASRRFGLLPVILRLLQVHLVRLQVNLVPLDSQTCICPLVDASNLVANGRNYMQGWISERHTVERCTAVARTDDRIPPPPDLTYSFCYWQCSFSSSSLSVVLLFVLLSETLRHLSPNRADFVHLSRH